MNRLHPAQGQPTETADRARQETTLEEKMGPDDKQMMSARDAKCGRCRDWISINA